MKSNFFLFLLLLLLLGGAYFLVSSSIQETAKMEVVPVNTDKEKPEQETALDTSLLATPVLDSFDIKIVDGFAQLNWKFLSRVKFDEVFNEEMDAYIPYPIFHDEIKAYDGKQVSISGYVIPIDETGNEQILVLSAFPYANCFFCGNAGPESVMDVQTKKKYEAMKMDTKVTFRGKLKLNDKDLYYLNYILEDAELVE